LCAHLEVVVTAAASAAQSPPVAPVEASLTVRLATAASTFAAGGLIPLELEFRGTAGPDYYFSTVRLTRWSPVSEQFLVTPADGAEDPHAEWQAWGGGIVGSLLSSRHPLDGTPFVVRAYLNDWVRFTRPGTYELIVTSPRLERHSRRPAPELRSNPVRLRIEPATPAWAAAELDRALAERADPDPGTVRHGTTVLRHLGTRAAALALVAAYGDRDLADRTDVRAALASSAFRAEIVRAMEVQVDAGASLPVGYVSSLALLRALAEIPVGTRDRATWFDIWAMFTAEYQQRWFGAVARTGASVDILAGVLTELASNGSSPFVDLAADLLADAVPDAARAWQALTAGMQTTLLQNRWAVLNQSWMRPTLDTLYAERVGNTRFPGLGDAVLTRILDIDPPTGETLLLDEIRTGTHGIAIDTLLALSTATWPNVAVPPGIDDTTLRRRFEGAFPAGRAAAGWLLWRFGSPSLVPLVRDRISQPVECAIEAPLLAYLLRHDPPAALARLQPGLVRRQGCARPPWEDLARRHWDERTEAVVVAQLRSPDLLAVSQAAQILGAYGSAQVKAPLMARLVQWGEEWRGRQAELDSRASQRDSPGLVENAVINALFRNTRITLDEADIAAMRARCLTGGCPTNVDGLAYGRQNRN
jgi:hypothetical protein